MPKQPKPAASFSEDHHDRADQPGPPGEEEEYWKSFRQLSIACMVFDLDTLQILSATRATERAFGYSSRGLEQLGLPDLWPDEEFGWRLEFVRMSALSNLPESGEGLALKFKRCDGTLFETDISFSDTYFNGRRLRVVKFPRIEPEDLEF